MHSYKFLIPSYCTCASSTAYCMLHKPAHQKALYPADRLTLVLVRKL